MPRTRIDRLYEAERRLLGCDACPRSIVRHLGDHKGGFDVRESGSCGRRSFSRRCRRSPSRRLERGSARLPASIPGSARAPRRAARSPTRSPRSIAGGEVNVLDSGGYGEMTITKSVTVNVAPGRHRRNRHASVADAVTVNAGLTDVIVLRGLTISATGSRAGDKALGFGVLHVENCSLNGSGAGSLGFPRHRRHAVGERQGLHRRHDRPQLLRRES